MDLISYHKTYLKLDNLDNLLYDCYSHTYSVCVCVSVFLHVDLVPASPTL